MKNIKKLIIVITVSLLFNCITVKLEATKDANFTEKINEVLILIEHGTLNKRFVDALSENILIEFEKYDIKSNVYILTGIELDNSVIDSKVDEYNSKYLFFIDLTEATVKSSKLQLSGTYDISIFDIKNEKRIWRGNLIINSMGMGSKQSANKFLEKLFIKLVEDEII